MKIENYSFQNNQRENFYNVQYKRKFLEYPYYSFIRRNKNVHAIFSALIL